MAYIDDNRTRIATPVELDLVKKTAPELTLEQRRIFELEVQLHERVKDVEYLQKITGQLMLSRQQRYRQGVREAIERIEEGHEPRQILRDLGVL